MDTKRKCMVGHDDDSRFIATCMIALIVVIIICTIIIYGGAFIGGFHSIKNYILAFKHNVYDSNRKPVPVE